jgi:hypothetical protein
MKLEIIREVRALTCLGLKEAKELVEDGGRGTSPAADLLRRRVGSPWFKNGRPRPQAPDLMAASIANASFPSCTMM